MTLASNISGFVIGRNVVKFNYSARECIASLRPICNEVIFSIDPTPDDGTYELAHELKEEFDLKIIESVWNMDNMDRGFEIGKQTQLAQARCNHFLEWRLSLQLDEGFQEDDHEKIKKLTVAPPADVNGFDFLRVYFYQNLHTIRKDWCVQLSRLTRKNTHTYMNFDGQNSNPLGGVSHIPTDIWLFHYSRLGDPAAIAKRVRNIDTFFHSKESLPNESDLPPYDFVPRDSDSYSSEANLHVVEGVFVAYEGTHPLSFTKLYQDIKDNKNEKGT